ncbi:hypothetical protein Tco_1488975, partial [Tanacetum coccineum]
MALLLAEERFLKIKQAMVEEQNQPEVVQELLLKLINDLKILKGIQPKKEESFKKKDTSLKEIINEKRLIDDKIKDITNELGYKRFQGEKIDDEYERDCEIKIEQLLQDYNGLDIEMRKKERVLMEEKNYAVSQRIKSICDDDEDDYIPLRDIIARYSSSKAITPDLPIEEPDNSLSMGDEHLDTIPSVEILVPIPSELEGISDDMCDVPVCEDPSTFDALNDNSEILSDSNDDDTSSDEDSFEDIEYIDTSPPDSELVSLEEVNDVDQEEKEFDLEDILQIQDV